MARKLLFFLLLLITACDKYNPVNDKIYAIPAKNNFISEASLQALEDATTNYPNNPENYYKKARYFLQKGESENALTVIQEVMQQDSTNQKYNFLLAKIYTQQEEYEEALQVMVRVPNQFENHFEALLLIGQLYYEQKEYDEAIKNLNKALKISKYDARPFYWKGRVSLARLDSAHTIEYLNEALKRKKNDVAVYNSFTELYNKFEMYRTALRYADKGLKIDPKYPLLNFNKAESYRLIVYFDDSARVYYERAYKADPGLAKASYRLGKYAFDEKKYTRAEKYLKSSLKYDPDFSYTNYYLGICYKRKREKEKALKLFKKAMDTDSKNYKARDMYWGIKNELERARMLKREDSLRRAYYRRLEEQRKERLERERQRLEGNE